MAADKQDRFNALRQQAAQVLAGRGAPSDLVGLDAMGLARLMEELSIYHEELKIQNEELSISNTRAEAAQAHYKLLFNVLPLPVLLVDAQGALIEDNDVSQDWLGPSRRFHHLDMRFTQALDRQDRPRVLRLLATLEATRKGQLADVRVTTFDQSEKQVDVHVARLPHDFHQDARYLVVLLDRSIEAARLAEQGLFNALLDSSDDLIYATDVHGRLMLANNGFLGTIGVSRDRALGRKLAEFWPLNNVTELQAHETEVLDRAQPLNFTESLQWRFDRPIQTWAVRKFPIKGRRGHIVGVASVCRDITAEQRADRASRLAAHVFAEMPVPVALTCNDGKVHFMNGALERLSGLAEQSLAGRALNAMLDSDRAHPPIADVREHVLEHGLWTDLLHVRHSNGRNTPVRAHVTRVRPTPEGEAMLMWVMSDGQTWPAAGIQPES